jgi:osmotically-inducible protein OsmY
MEVFMSKDDQLQGAVLAELHWEPSVVAAHIGVTAKDGVVTLTGHVENYANKHAAETAARRVKGVYAVAEEIEVRLPNSIKRSDDEIAATALDRLGWDVSIKRDSVKLTVTSGWVTLTGQVDWHYQKEAAQQDIRGLYGVIGVTNKITLMPRVNIPNLANDIMRALHRNWFDAGAVKVHADGGKVILTGTVHTPHDRQLATAAAWAAPGATAVENDLVIV